MEQPAYLIDTNAVIDYLGQKLNTPGMNFMNAIIDSSANVSVITKIEVLGFNTHDLHYKLLSDFMNDSIIHELEPDVVEKTIELRKKYKTKLPDAIIAATAIVNNLSLVTRNIDDFKSILELKVIDPHQV